MKRSELVKKLKELAALVTPNHQRLIDDIHPANAKSYISHFARLQDFKPYLEQLLLLARETEEMIDYSNEFTALVNQLYAETNEPVNREIIYPILKKYMVNDTPFDIQPSTTFPNPWITHTDLLIFDTKENAIACMQELEPYVTFDRTQDEVKARDSECRYVVGYELKAWNEAFDNFKQEYNDRILSQEEPELV